MTDDRVLLSAIDLTTPQLRVSLSDHRLIAVLYEDRLSDLGLQPGIVPAPNNKDPRRPLPLGFELQEADFQTTPIDWSPLPEMPKPIEDYGLPTFDDASCGENNGCMRFFEEERYCEIPCQRPEPPAPPALPDPPRKPVLTPCPDGWQEEPLRLDNEVRFCEPRSLTPCSNNEQVRFPGDTDCAPVGGACPPGDWPIDLPTDRPILFVKSATTSGDGTQDHPFATITAALLGSDNAVIAVAKGTYQESIELADTRQLIGACAAETILSAPASSNHQIYITGDNTVSGFTLRGESTASGIVVTEQRNVVLENIAIFDAKNGLSIMARATVDARNLLIRRSDQVGLFVFFADANVSVVRGSFDDNPHGVRVGSSTVTMEQVNIRRSTTRGLYVAGGSVSVEQGLIDEAQEISILESSRLQLKDTLVSNTPFTRIVGAALELERVVLRNENSLVVEQDGSLYARDLIVDQTTSKALISHTNDLQLEQVFFAETDGIQLSGSSSAISDVSVMNDPNLVFGGGILLAGGPFKLTRVATSYSVGPGIGIARETTATLNHATIDHPRNGQVAVHGYGIEIRNRGDLTAGPLAVAGSAGAGILNRCISCPPQGGACSAVPCEQAEQPVLHLFDVTVRDSIDTGMDFYYGVVDVSRAHLLNNNVWGIAASACNLQLEDIRVENNGTGIRLSGHNQEDTGVTELDRFVVEDSNGSGVVLRQFAPAVLKQGAIHGNEIGIELESDAGALLFSEPVVFEDNIQADLKSEQ